MITTGTPYTTANAADSKCPVYVVKISAHPNMLVGAWELDEASGQRADYTGRNEFTPVNAPGTSAGKTQAAALQLTAASSQYLRCSVYDNSCLIMNDETFMITCWVYLDSKGADRTIASHAANDVSTNNSWILRYNSGLDRFDFTIGYTDATTATVTASTLGSPSTGTWYFIVAYFDRTDNTVKIQVNNGTVNSSSALAPPAAAALHMQASATDLRIGAWYNSGITGFWDGRIEQFTMWRRILSTGERSSLYNSGSGAAFTVVTDPSPYIFSTSSNLASENTGTALLEMGELFYQSLIEKSEAPLSRLTFTLNDTASVISAMVAAGVIGYKVRLYAGFYSLAFSEFTQLFGGRISEITHDGTRFRFTCQSYLSFAQEKIVFNSAATTLLLAVNDIETTFIVADASQFPDAQSVPQSYRQLIMVDSEMCEYRGRSQGSGFSTSAWNLQQVVRSSQFGYPLPPYFGGPAVHGNNRLVRHLPKKGQLVPETSQADEPWMHPIRLAQDTLNNIGNQGVGESVIPLNFSSWSDAQADLGPTLQFRYVFSEGMNGKKLLESICRDVGGYLIQSGDGGLGIKLYPFASTLHAAWELDESSGERQDYIHINRNRNYNLTPVNTPGSTAGALQLTAASSQYLWCHPGGLQPAAADFSIGVWVYIDSKGADRAIMSQWGLTGYYQSWRLWYSGGADRFTFTISDGVASTNLNADALGSPSTGTWYYIAASFNRSTLQMRISVNDGTVNTTTATNYPAPVDELFRMGAIGNGAGTATNFWDGRIDGAGLWFDHILTATEISYLYNGGSGVFFSSYLSAFPAFTPSSVGTVNDGDVIERPRWLRNGELAVNAVIYHYDYVPAKNEFASLFEYKDYSLIDAMGKQLTLEIFSKGIRSRHYFVSSAGAIFCWFDSTERFLMSRAEAYIQRFGRESPIIGATTLLKKHLIELGDDATVTFDQVVNLTTGVRALSSADVEVSVMRHRFQANVVDFEFTKYA